MRKVLMEDFLLDPDRYVLKSGMADGAPLCPYGNHFEWVGYDTKTEEYIRFSKSVFKKLVNELPSKS